MWPGLLDAAQDYDVNLLCFPGGRLGVQPAFESQRNAVYNLLSKDRIDGLVSWASTLGVGLGQAEIRQFSRPLPTAAHGEPGPANGGDTHHRGQQLRWHAFRNRPT